MYFVKQQQIHALNLQKNSALFCVVESDLFEIKINLLNLGDAKLEMTPQQYRGFDFYLTVL